MLSVVKWSCKTRFVPLFIPPVRSTTSDIQKLLFTTKIDSGFTMNIAFFLSFSDLVYEELPHLFQPDDLHIDTPFGNI